MWDYWRDKKGVLGAMDQYDEARKDPAIAAAVSELQRAESALDALMRKWDEDHRSPPR